MIDFRLCVITDGGGALSARRINDLCAAGVRAVQLRAPRIDARELFARAVELRRVTGKHNTAFFVNGRYDISLAAEADGVHLPDDTYPPRAIQRNSGDGPVVGVSTHSLERARRAEEEGADYVFFGPVYDTPSKRRFGPPQGIAALRDVCNAAHIPVVAIGGITPQNAAACLDAGGSAVAVISAVMDADDVAAAVNDFRKVIGAL